MTRAEIFRHKDERYSSYGKCAECPCKDACRICPVAIGYDGDNTGPRCIPDFISAFNRVTLKYRDLFPRMPKPLDRLNAVLRKIISSSS